MTENKPELLPEYIIADWDDEGNARYTLVGIKVVNKADHDAILNAVRYTPNTRTPSTPSPLMREMGDLIERQITGWEWRFEHWNPSLIHESDHEEISALREVLARYKEMMGAE